MIDAKKGSDKQSRRLIKTICGVTAGVVLLSLLTGCGSEIDKNATDEHDGLLYKINATKPYTGVVRNKRSGVVATYRKGKLHGKWTWTNSRGVICTQGNWKDGKKHGKWMEHDIEGNKKYINWENGIPVF